MSIAIRVDGLSKRYLIGHERANASQYGSFREAIGRRVAENIDWIVV